MSQPPTPPYPQQPPPAGWPPAPPTPPKKKRRGLLIGLIVGGVVLLCLCGGVIALLTNGSDDTTGTATVVDEETTAGEDGETSAKSTDNPKPDTATLGQPVRDGKFEFVVQKVKCGVPTVGDQYLGEKAQGQFCLVTLSVKNIGDKAQTFNDFNQRAYDAQGREYETDTEAGLYANEDTTDVWLTEINPGNQIKGILVFDISKGSKLTRIELHDSTFSGGVEVRI